MSASCLRSTFSNYKVTLTLMFFFSLFAYNYRLFERNLSVKTVMRNNFTSQQQQQQQQQQPSFYYSTHNHTEVLYKQYSFIYNSFGVSDTAVALDFLNSIFMNFACVVVIVVLNVLTLIKTRKCLNRKRALTTTTVVSRWPLSPTPSPLQSTATAYMQHSNGTTTTNTCSVPSASSSNHMNGNGYGGYAKDITVRSRMKISKAEMNISLMVFTSGIIALLGNGFTFFYRLPFNATGHYGNFCFYSVANFALSLSYAMNFFIYLVFHKNFRKCFYTLFGSFGKFVFHGTAFNPNNNNLNHNVVSL